jgi:hypothetical protein
MLNKRADSAPAAAGVGRASALAWAGLKVAAMVLLAAGVAHGLGDGDEFDEAGCSVAQQPGGSCHGARSAQARERDDGNLPGAAAPDNPVRRLAARPLRSRRPQLGP